MSIGGHNCVFFFFFVINSHKVNVPHLSYKACLSLAYIDVGVSDMRKSFNMPIHLYRFTVPGDGQLIDRYRPCSSVNAVCK